MNKLSHFYGFPVKNDYRFTIGGRRYRVGADGSRSLIHLANIYDRCCSAADRQWAMAARPIIRQIEILNKRAVLCLVIDRTQDRVLRNLAIWLRGRCRSGSTGLTTLAKFADHPDFHTRKEVARALKRMSAWRILAVMANADSSGRVRRMATFKPSRPIAQRIADLTRNVARHPVQRVRKTIFVSQNLDTRRGKPPKSPSRIRVILERIRNLVKGNSSQD